MVLDICKEAAINQYVSAWSSGVPAAELYDAMTKPKTGSLLVNEADLQKHGVVVNHEALGTADLPARLVGMRLQQALANQLVANLGLAKACVHKVQKHLVTAIAEPIRQLGQESGALDYTKVMEIVNSSIGST